MLTRLEGRVAVVTGAGSGLGRAIAVRFAQEGASVTCQDLSGGAAEATAESIREQGGKSIAWSCDVTDPLAIDEMFTMAGRDLGTVDLLVNCAGVSSTPGDASGEEGIQLLLMSDGSWRRMLDVHLNGAYYCTRPMIRALLEAQLPGSVICISSVAATAGIGPVHYATAKAGLLGFVRSLARVLAPYGIRTNAICPGLIDTPMTESLPQARVEEVLAMTPLRRRGNPADIAAAAAYLASDEAAFVTGQVLSPNGGLVIA